MSLSVLPSSVACPLCGVPPRHKCVTKQGYSAPTHTARWKTIGIAKPTLDDQSSDWDDWGGIEVERRAASDKERAAWWEVQKAKGLEYATSLIKERVGSGAPVGLNELAKVLKGHLPTLGPYSEILAQQALNNQPT